MLTPLGSIPARAGKPPGDHDERLRTGVYPRTGGETSLRAVTPLLLRGLSPHGRGNPLQVRQAAIPEGSIPARAGKPDHDG